MSPEYGVAAGRVSLPALLLAALLLLGVPTVFAQGPPEIFDNGATNGASFRPPDFPGGHMASGSIISIFGRNFHSGDSVSSMGFPLPTELGPLGTRVLVNGAAQCPLFFVSETQINCQLPFGPAADQVRLRVVNSSGESNEISVQMRPIGFGMFAVNQNSRGPLVISNISDDPDPAKQFQPHNPESPARPGQFVVFWGSGLGPSEPAVPAGQAAAGPAPALQQPRVLIGDRPAQVTYAGRAPNFAGLDQINVIVPEDAPLGCAVPVRVEIGDQVSNIGTMSITTDGLPCRDPFEDIFSGLSHGSIVLSSGLGRLGPGQLGPEPGFSGPFPHNDDHGPGMGPGGMGPGGGPSQGHGPGMGFGGGVGPGPGGVGPDGIGPFGLHPGIHGHAGGAGLGLAAGFGSDVATARFVRLSANAQMDIGIPPATSGSCNSHFQMAAETADMFLGPVQFLDAGPLTLSGPGVNLALEPRAVAAGALYAAALPNALEMGAYSVSGAGGADVGAFGPVEMQVPALLELTSSLEAGTEVSREQPFTLTWVGGNPDDIVLIHGRSFLVPLGTPTPLADPFQFRSHTFLCATTAGAGQFTIPDYVWQALPNGLLVLNVTHMPSETGIARFEASGLDEGGVFRWIDTTTYLDLVLGP